MPPSRSLTRFISSLVHRHHTSSFASSFSPPLGVTVTIYTRCLPELPPEVWLHIFRFATEYKSTFHPFDFSLPKRFSSVDDGVDDSDSESSTISFMSFPHSRTHFDMRLRAYFSMMTFKLLLSLVCKQWYKIAQDLMFESIWINRPFQATLLARVLTSSCVSSPSPSASSSSLESASDNPFRFDTKGRFIKRLHIETRTMDRCSPEDLRIIINHAPCLIAYTDYRSIRRSVYQEDNTRSSPKELFNALVHNQSALRNLSWTNYEDLQFHRHLPRMISRGVIADSLEFLELTFCSSSAEIIRNNVFQQLSSLHPPTSSSSLSSSSLIPSSSSLTLPRLRSLKLALDNPTFSVFASWSLPSLQNVCVVSADFSYASGLGFCSFFRTHGYKLLQLELGHSSSVISEHVLIIPVADDLNNYHAAFNSRMKSVRLADWCPNLVQFICSADAEWNWENPDWIAPHILLPSHPNLEMIGIRDIDKRLKDDMHTPANTFDNPFYMLLDQIETLLQRDSFPRLRYIRDLSYESDEMRQSAISQDVIDFWIHIIDRCRQTSVYVENFRGVNITQRNIHRAIAIKIEKNQIAESKRLMEESYDTPVKKVKEWARLVLPRLAICKWLNW
ncbi:hypothetical protein JOM56_003027 [Amanita muscaria]